MKRLLLVSFVAFLLISCGPRTKNTRGDADLIYPSLGLFETNFKYLYFGKIGYRDRSFQEDTLVYPPFEGLVHQSAYVICPIDTCFAERAVLALRCPPIQTLLDWVADTVYSFTHECPIGNGLLTYNEKEIDIPKKHFKSAEAICDYYIGKLRHVYDEWHCTGEGDHDSINEQAGLLLAECWNTSYLHTFYRIDWYDWLSAGNNARESWWTVNATTGNLMTLDDFVRPEMKDSLSTLMMPRIINGNGESLIRENTFYTANDKGVLFLADGCALIPEGLVIFFYPYNLGSGAEGEYEAVIPYDKLDGILKEPLSALLATYLNRTSVN